MKKGNGRWLKGVVFAVLLGAAKTPAQLPPDAPTQNGATLPPTVTRVRVVGEDQKVLSEAPLGIAVDVGKPLDRKKVAESLRALYRTGNYADLKAMVTPEGEGVRLDFVAKENLFFNQVQIEGLVAPPTQASAAASMQLGLGQTYREAAVNEALERLKETLREEGLYLANVSAEKIPRPERHQMEIVVHVKSGPRARVGAIRLSNDSEFSDSQILSRSKLRIGQEATTAKLQRASVRIRKYLVKKGHLSARTGVRRGEYDVAKNTIPLELDVTEGPKIQVTVTGAKFSEGELKKLIPIYQEGAVDVDLLEEGKRNLRERLEREAYFDAEVKYTTSTHVTKGKEGRWQGTEELIAYTVERGERHKLIGIEIAGNKYFDTELLRSRLQIFGGAFASRGRFSRKLVDSDAQSMRSLYQANGFLDARVEAQVEDNYRGKEGNLFVRFNVEEGKQTRVASLSLEGVQAFKKEELLAVIGSTRGQPYSDSSVTTDRDNILALYFNEGFPEARFTATAENVSPDPPSQKESEGKNSPFSPENGEKSQREKESTFATEQGNEVRLVYRIEEGPQTRVRNIYTTGYEHTRPGVIRREIRIKVKEPLREGEVVESQRQLYNLGVFNRVTIEPQNLNGTDPEKDIAVLVEEAKRYTIAYGGGFEVQRLASTASPTAGEIEAAPRGIFEVSKQNLTGRADSLSFKLRGSTLQGRALLGYSVPDTFGDPHLSFQATAFAEKARDINTFTQERYEGSLQLTDQFTPLTTVLYHYAFRQVRVFDLKILAQEVPLFNQPTLVSQFGVTWFRDSRDNPADASKGSFNSADLSDADTTFGSSANFLRFSFQNSTYYPIKRRFGFARSLRFGLMVPYRGTVSLNFPEPTPGQCLPGATATGPTPTIIPLPERFFAGGGTSLRGFALNQAGPRDPCTGFPVGGQALLILNQEFRFPMRLPFLGTSLGGAIFYDGGNVYSRLTRISFRGTLPAPSIALQQPALPQSPTNLPQCISNCTNELNYFGHTVGLGLRYKTPVGPIRIDLGYQINRPRFVVPIPCPSSSNASTCQLGSLGQQSTRLPGFQIFFNLGSSF